MNGTELTSRVAAAITDSKYSWRTASGIAKELTAKLEDVERILNESGKFVRTPTPNSKGEVLYTTMERYKLNTPLIRRVFGAAANTVSSAVSTTVSSGD